MTVESLFDHVVDIYRVTVETTDTLGDPIEPLALVGTESARIERNRGQLRDFGAGEIPVVRYSAVMRAGADVRDRDVFHVKQGPVAPAKLRVLSPAGMGAYPSGAAHHLEIDLEPYAGNQ